MKLKPGPGIGFWFIRPTAMGLKPVAIRMNKNTVQRYVTARFITMGYSDGFETHRYKNE